MFEHFGRWETEAENFLHHLSRRSLNTKANLNAFIFKTYWRKRFSTILQRCNANWFSENFQDCLIMIVIWIEYLTLTSKAKSINFLTLFARTGFLWQTPSLCTRRVYLKIKHLSVCEIHSEWVVYRKFVCNFHICNKPPVSVYVSNAPKFEAIRS